MQKFTIEELKDIQFPVNQNNKQGCIQCGASNTMKNGLCQACFDNAMKALAEYDVDDLLI